MGFPRHVSSRITMSPSWGVERVTMTTKQMKKSAVLNTVSAWRGTRGEIRGSPIVLILANVRVGRLSARWQFTQPLRFQPVVERPDDLIAVTRGGFQAFAVEHGDAPMHVTNESGCS